MWFSFWRSRDRFTLDELRYLTEQLQKIQVVNEVNKGFVVEALRSIAELVTYGDQHDSSFFEFFMEKQIMGEFVRILKVSKITNVPLQLPQTMSIMIQNLRSEHAINYIFSNEHINSLIMYSFDFQNEELLSYYISFLRAISGKLSMNTISLLVKTENVFVLRRQLLILYSGGALSDLLLVNSPSVSTLNSRAKVAGMEVLIPKPGTEIFIAEAIPCRIAFERGKERHFSFLAVSRGTSGWVLLVDELPLKPQYGVIRVAAPLAGSNPNIDDKHQKWLHLRIRPTLPGIDPSKSDASTKGKAKVVVDGRWILAFRDEQACKSAESMILEEMHLQSSEVEKRVKAMLDLD